MGGFLSILGLFLFQSLASQDSGSTQIGNSGVAQGSGYNAIRADAEERYGPDADLLNGEKYNYAYRSDRGTPFFEVPGDPLALVQIKGKIYENQKIRFDIYNQLMVLDYLDRSGAPGSIILRDEWTDDIRIGAFLFKKFPDAKGNRRFGQVIFEGSFSCLYFWEKNYLPDLHEGENHYYFTEPMRQAVVINQGNSTPFTGNRSFLDCYPDGQVVQIKKYLKEQRIRVKKAPDQEMMKLMEYINQIPGHEE